MHGLPSCTHKFCLNCIVDYLEFNISNGQVVKIKCADAACKQEYTRDDIRKFGSQPIFEKYLKFKENIDVNINPNLRWCPKPDCNRFVEKGRKGKATCDCGWEICFKCGLQWHGKSKCDQVADKEFFGWAQSNGNIGNCPKCKARVEKMSGCNHMRCYSCQYQFCWLCGKKYSSEHYNIVNIFGCPG